VCFSRNKYDEVEGSSSWGLKSPLSRRVMAVKDKMAIPRETVSKRYGDYDNIN
jgi:hypothetical protein